MPHFQMYKDSANQKTAAGKEARMAKHGRKKRSPDSWQPERVIRPQGEVAGMGPGKEPKGTPSPVPSAGMPAWLRWPAGLPKPEHVHLQSSRDEFYRALSLFHDHVKHVIYIMVSIPALILIFMRVYPGAEANPATIFIAAILLISLFFIKEKATTIIRRYYQVYLSALVFCTRVHEACEQISAHPWIERTISQAMTHPDVRTSLEFLEVRADSKDDTFDLYRRIIGVICTLSLICGSVLLVFAFLGTDLLSQVKEFSTNIATIVENILYVLKALSYNHG